MKIWLIRSLLVVVPLSILGGIWFATRPSESSSRSHLQELLLLPGMNEKDVKELKWYIDHPKEDSIYKSNLKDRSQDLITYITCRERVRNYLKAEKRIKELRETPLYKRDYTLRNIFLPSRWIYDSAVSDFTLNDFRRIINNQYEDSTFCLELKKEGKDYERYICEREAIRTYDKMCLHFKYDN